MRALVLVTALAACQGGAKSAAPIQEKPKVDPNTPDLQDPLRNQPGGPPDGDEDEGGAEVVGAIPKDSIHRVVKENWRSIRQCYEQLVMASPGLQGRVIAKFSVGLDGTVQDASVAGVHPDLETCVATQIRKFKFPRPEGVKGDVLVTYPFNFKQ